MLSLTHTVEFYVFLMYKLHVSSNYNSGSYTMMETVFRAFEICEMKLTWL